MPAEKGNKYALGNNGGRPPKYSTPEELEAKILEYFEKANDEETPENITITGLILYLGFSDRSSFYDYEKKDEFSHIIKRAKLVVENRYEESLKYKSPTGAIFALKNMGWKDRSEVSQTVTNVNYNTELSKDEIKEINDALEKEV